MRPARTIGTHPSDNWKWCELEEFNTREQNKNGLQQKSTIQERAAELISSEIDHPRTQERDKTEHGLRN